MSPAKDRVRAWRYGHLAEARAALLLRLKGYRILARRYRTPVGEIDVIAKRGKLLAMVEVKGRAGGAAANAAEALGAPQRRRIERAAAAWLAGHPGSAACDVRFDLIVVGSGPLPRHLPGAWLAGD